MYVPNFEYVNLEYKSVENDSESERQTLYDRETEKHHDEAMCEHILTLGIESDTETYA